MIPALGLYDFSTTKNEKIIKLPLFYGLAEKDDELISNSIKRFLINVN